MKQSIRFLLLSLPVVIFVCVLTQMIVANEMIVVSNRLHTVEKRLAEIEEQNTYLRQQVVQLSSITRVSKEAELLGFVDAKHVVAFTNESFPVAIRR